MRKIIKLIFLSAALLMAASCKWVSSTDTYSLQPWVVRTFENKTSTELLTILGHPTSVQLDTIDDIPITIMRFEDKITLMEFANYSEKFQTEDPYIVTYSKNGKCYSVKTNMVKTKISRNEYKVSIVKLATYSGIMLFAIIITCIIILTTKGKAYEELEEETAELKKRISAEETFSRKLDSAVAQNLKEIQKRIDWVSKLEIPLKGLEKQVNALAQQVSVLEKDISNDHKDLFLTKRRLTAVRAALNSLAEQNGVTPIEDIESLPSDDEQEASEQVPDKPQPDTKLPLRELSARVCSVLRAHEIDTFEKLCSFSRWEVFHFKNLGRGSLKELDELLKRYGYSFR